MKLPRPPKGPPLPRAAELEPIAVARRVMAVLGADIPAYVLLALLLVGVPTVLSDSSLMAEGTEPVLIFGSAVLQVLLTAIVSHSVLARLGGAPVPIGASIVAGLRFWPLAFAVQLVSGLGVLLGLVLLIVPGVVLSLRWLVPVQAVIAEQIGMGASLKRSAALTDGRRLQLFGLMLSWLVPFLLLPILVVRSMTTGGAPDWSVAGVDMAFDMAGALASAAGLSVIYWELLRLAAARVRIGPIDPHATASLDGNGR